MVLEELKNLTRGGENQFVEFKRKLNHPEKVVREIVAFANSKGGHLLLGVDDSGSLSGLKFAEEDHFELQQSIKSLCKPTIKYSAKIVPVGSKKSVVCYRIPESSRKLHYAKENPSDVYGKAYFRVEDKSIQASKELREILKRERRRKDFKLIYGKTEQLLIAFIGQSEKGVTLLQCVEHTGIKKYFVSKSLINMVLANVLMVVPSEKGDLFKAVTY